MSITVKLQRFDDLVAALDRKGKRLTTVERAIAISAEQVRGEAVRTLQKGSRSGRIYEVGSAKYKRPGSRGSSRKRKRTHQASAPGEPLKSDTGNLASHIFARLRPGTAEVGTSVDYGAYWERDAPGPKQRPWLAPSFVKHKKTILDRVSRAVSAAFRA